MQLRLKTALLSGRHRQPAAVTSCCTASSGNGALPLAAASRRCDARRACFGEYQTRILGRRQTTSWCGFREIPTRRGRSIGEQEHQHMHQGYKRFRVVLSMV